MRYRLLQTPMQSAYTSHGAAGGSSGEVLEMGGMPLPRPGAPEPLSGYVKLGDCGCGCKGAGKCGGLGKGLSGITGMGAFDASSLKVPALVAGGAYLFWKMFLKK